MSKKILSIHGSKNRSGTPEVFSIEQSISNFHNRLKNDSHHRYKSWEHCFLYFQSDESIIDVDLACLHLSFYLASWGMYRGSSFLLWKDYLIHKEIVIRILKSRDLQSIDYYNITGQNIDRILDLISWIKKWYPQNIDTINADADRKIIVSDTLATKILLGTLGCIPAYDRFFIDGMRKSGIAYSKVNKKNITSITKYYQNNELTFRKLQNELQLTNGKLYPVMKLIDMHFWEIGYQLKN